MNTRFLTLFVVALLIIVIAVVVILAFLFHVGPESSPPVTATPASSGAALTVRNDTAHAVQVQDCTSALRACAAQNTGTTRLSAGAAGTERGATGLRILNVQGGVLGCIALAGTPSGSTVLVSSAKPCP